MEVEVVRREGGAEGESSNDGGGGAGHSDEGEVASGGGEEDAQSWIGDDIEAALATWKRDIGGRTFEKNTCVYNRSI